MSTAPRKESPCDRCGGTVGVEKRLYGVPAKRHQRTLDLCADCRSTVPVGELDALVESGRRHTLTRRVLTEEEIAKAASRRKRPRRVVKR